MKIPVVARFEERATGRKVVGHISPTTFEEVQAQQGWQFAPDALDRKWNWQRIWMPCRTAPTKYECYSATVSGELQGLIFLDLRGRYWGVRRMLVVDYLATNPQNRKSGQGFKYLGVCLMAVAAARSVELGMEGCVWLESLPDSQTLKFYENLGMTRQVERSADGYDIFVFEFAQAKEFLLTVATEKWITL